MDALIAAAQPARLKRPRRDPESEFKAAIDRRVNFSKLADILERAERYIAAAKRSSDACSRLSASAPDPAAWPELCDLFEAEKKALWQLGSFIQMDIAALRAVVAEGRAES